MMKSYLKSRIYEQLKLHGHIPEVDEDTDPDAGTDVALNGHGKFQGASNRTDVHQTGLMCIKQE